MKIKGLFKFAGAAFFTFLIQNAEAGPIYDQAIRIFEDQMKADQAAMVECGLTDHPQAPFYRLTRGHPIYGNFGVTLTAHRCDGSTEREMGFAFLKISDSFHIAHLRSFGNRGEGIGSSLVSISIRLASALNFDEVTVNSSNHAVGFYEKQGFKFGAHSHLGFVLMAFSLR